MKILFIGDIFGRPGRQLIENKLPEVIKEHAPDLIIANAENICHGSGFTPANITQMQQAGVHFFTLGNHAFRKQSGVNRLNDPDFPVIRPANYPESAETPGRGYQIFEHNNYKTLIINLMGREGMKVHLDCPFRKADQILEQHKDHQLNAIFVDFHTETTSEKIALATYLDGRITALIGTHTHVPTADARLLTNGTAFMTDAGMNGIIDSIIGLKAQPIIQKMLTQISTTHEPADQGRTIFTAALIAIDPSTQKAVNITHLTEIK
ncbi:metallophosphoesterase [Candidatus Peregrinibacteria bacterium HGW-Peregrinibacteria-1]|jgi:metallophosphoesterase (TIGR00282 family)|nr:MAG: metallophosphoesterase [Candidatus Peregrinibacteria bacterium HGW-Peregrinibacteria-1]